MLRATLERFDELLQERLNAEVFTTEDSIRYTFFHALIEAGYCKLVEVILEMSHPAIPRAQIDLLILAAQNRPSVAFEFKYDRAIPSGKNLPRPQKAGAVFKDLFRLARIPRVLAQDRYFIYITGPEMLGYFQNPRNHFVKFFNLKEKDRFVITDQFVESQVQTFRNYVKGYVLPCFVVGAYRQDLPNQHALRIFQVVDRQ
jgi:hypothetical protein